MRDVSEITPGLDNVGQPLEYLVTAGQPEEEHLKRLAEAGYKTVVDLRTPGETPRPEEWGMVVRQSGIEYVNIPVAHKNIDDETFDRFRGLIRDGGRRPVLVHCSSANRVGALLIPYPDPGRGHDSREDKRDRRRGGLEKQQTGAGGISLRERQYIRVF